MISFFSSAYGFLEPGSIPAASAILRDVEPMKDRLVEFAKLIQGRPWNSHGSDKTWVLDVSRQHQLFVRELREASRVDTHERPLRWRRRAR